VRRDLILAGVGGQGLLSLAAVLGDAALHSGLHVKQAEVHGMAQRGGAVQSHLRMSSETIHSDLVEEGSADLLVSLEPMEALRYLPCLAPEGTIVTAIASVENVAPYPDVDAVLDALRACAPTYDVDAHALAKEAGSPRSTNMVLAGACGAFVDLPLASLEEAVHRLFAAKGARVVDVNVKALRLGLAEIQRRDACAAFDGQRTPTTR
jgi:indolepyruvate ferredoxin oxidoreductase beta subunit